MAIDGGQTYAPRLTRYLNFGQVVPTPSVDSALTRDIYLTLDGTPQAGARIARVLWNDPATGVMRHADAGYEIAIDCARENNLDLPGLA